MLRKEEAEEKEKIFSELEREQLYGEGQEGSSKRQGKRHTEHKEIEKTITRIKLSLRYHK